MWSLNLCISVNFVTCSHAQAHIDIYMHSTLAQYTHTHTHTHECMHNTLPKYTCMQVCSLSLSPQSLSLSSSLPSLSPFSLSPSLPLPFFSLHLSFFRFLFLGIGWWDEKAVCSVKSVVKHFESLKALYKFPVIVIVVAYKFPVTVIVVALSLILPYCLVCRSSPATTTLWCKERVWRSCRNTWKPLCLPCPSTCSLSSRLDTMRRAADFMCLFCQDSLDTWPAFQKRLESHGFHLPWQHAVLF